MTDDSNNSLDKRLTNFDPDFSPQHPTNQEAARQRGLVYDSEIEFYIDADRCLIRDRFGQSC